MTHIIVAGMMLFVWEDNFNFKKIILSITAILLGLYFINLALKDDVQEIRKNMYSLHQPRMNIAHIELLDKNQAIAFYERGNHENLYFGSAFLGKIYSDGKLLVVSQGNFLMDIN